MNAIEICKCGIAASDCEYHADAEDEECGHWWAMGLEMIQANNIGGIVRYIGPPPPALEPSSKVREAYRVWLESQTNAGTLLQGIYSRLKESLP